MAKYTTKDIIQQFVEKHGGRYNYSLVDYIHSQKKVKIICSEHGVFLQLVGAHRRGQGCPKCAVAVKKSTTTEIVERFREIHREKYDYSLVVYLGIDRKVKIICLNHGLFYQTPWHHLQGNGCPKCIGRNKTQSEVLKAFRQVHGLRYDYSLVDYELMMRKVKIVCREHGVFEQTPQKHLKGQGCIKCAGVYLLSTEEIIKQFKVVHGDRYDYSLVIYKGGEYKVKIVCREHGVFKQTANSHKAGNGCPKCAGVYLLSTEEIIKQFKVVHGDRYDYSLVIYKGIFCKIEIVCKEHGSFFQSAKSHRNGSGCPKCAITIDHTKASYINLCKNHANGDSYLYIIKCFDKNEEFYKIGISYYGAKLRFNTKVKMPYKFVVLDEFKGRVELIWELEKKIHKVLRKSSITPRKKFSGATECFHLTSNMVEKLLLIIRHYMQNHTN